MIADVHTSAPKLSGFTTSAFGPVSVEEVMDYLDIDTSDQPAYNLLSSLLKTAREKVEKFTGLSLVVRNLSIYWRTYNGDETLPFGPVHAAGRTVTTGGSNGADLYELTITDDVLDSDEFPQLHGCYRSGVRVEYTAGFNSEYRIPETLRTAVMSCCADMFISDTGYKPKGPLNRNWRVLAASERRIGDAA